MLAEKQSRGLITAGAKHIQFFVTTHSHHNDVGCNADDGHRLPKNVPANKRSTIGDNCIHLNMA